MHMISVAAHLDGVESVLSSDAADERPDTRAELGTEMWFAMLRTEDVVNQAIRVGV
jgi:hypothetical protein